MHSQKRRGAMLGYINILVKNAVNLLYTPMLLSYVGQEDYGVFQTSNSFVFSLTLLTFGFSGAYVRFYTQREADGDEEGIRILNGMYLLLYFCICLIVVLVGMVCSANVRSIFASGFTTAEIELAGRLVAVMSINVAITLFSTVFDAFIMAHEEFTFQQTRQILTSLSIPAFALFMLHMGAGTVGVAVAQLTVNLTLLILNGRFATGKLGMRFNLVRFDFTLLKAVATFSAWIFVYQICDLVNQNVPNVILGASCGADVVAVFAVALQIRALFISLSAILSNVFVPQVNRIVADSNDNEKLTKLMTRVGRYQSWLLCWVYGGFVLLGRFFVAMWAGESFSDAYLLVLLMVLPLLVPLCQNVGIEIQKAKNMHRARGLAYLLMAVVGVCFTLAAAPHLSYWAAAAAYILSIVLGNCLFMNWYYHFRVGLDMGYYWKRILPVVICAAGAIMPCIIGIRFLSVTNITSFLIWGLIYTLIYCAMCWGIALDDHEKIKVSKYVSRITRRDA